MTGPDDDEDGERTEPAERVSRLSTQLVDGSTDRRVTVAHELDEVAEEYPEAVTSAVPALRTALSANEEPVRAAAALVIATVAANDPRVAAPAATDLASLLGDSEPTANNALSALLALLGPESEAVLSAVEPRIDDLSAAADAETPLVRQRAVGLLFAFADSRPAALADNDAVPTLAAVLDRPASVERESLPAPTDGPKQRFSEFVGRQARRDRSSRGSGRRLAAAALARMAADRPEALAGELERLREHVHDEDPGVRAGVFECFGQAAAVDPAMTRAVVPDLAEALFDTSESVPLRTSAAMALGLTAEVDMACVAEAVEPACDDLASLLDAEDDGHRGAVVGLVAYLAEYDPDLVAPARDRLRARLDDDRAFVRGNAASALGFCGDEAARDALVDRAESDHDDSVRRAAADALKRLDASE